MTTETMGYGWYNQKTKVDVNLALDRAAGYTLTTDERREWWIENDRFLRMLNRSEYDSLMAEAASYPA